MGLLSFDEFLKSNPKDKVYLVDTSFIVKALDPSSKEFQLMKKLSGKIGFAYNVVIKKELLHYLRYLILSDMIESKNPVLHPRLYKLWENSNDPIKELCNEGYAQLFRNVFGLDGQLLKQKMEHALVGLQYFDGKKNRNASNWDRVFAIMAIYGLDSSDAMILNFAIGDETFAGIITSDADFRVCGDVHSNKSFDIILPSASKARPLTKPWAPSQ